ncbi:sensor histidine kinase [Ideonella sp.]|uniref:sensor histidine kinase n=1 Tax=Ideonella sp. TaxID=1929293 RepID=UPI002B48060D|nr:sensor histidine kinase [Ideonella sp.]HJV69059.1 sensor histidine kinase [Ideonella sp.]
MSPSRHRWTRSLRFRLLAATLVALLVALLLAGVLLAGLFREHVQGQFAATLRTQLDQLTARLEFDPAGRPVIDPQALTDPRWSSPYSGLYWQLDAAGATPQRGVLRSRSLWDAELVAEADALAPGAVHVHEIAGPGGTRLLLVERTVRRDDPARTPWRLLVAADLRETDAAVARFNGVLTVSLAALLGLLGAAAVAQVAVGLAPLRALERALADVHEGRAARLEGRFPAEVQRLTDDFNAVLDRNAEVVARARTQAGNLAHAIKTPLAAMAQAADAARQRPESAAELAALVQEQVAVARRQVDWHLARSRAAAAQGVPGARVALAPVFAGLWRVLQRVHAERGLMLAGGPIDPALAFAGEAQDLHEMLGNLLDNACKWARHELRVSAAPLADGRRLRIVIDDDGPGIDAGRREAVLARGARLDESVPGSGLGLAIVQELASLYGGELALGRADAGGLRAELTLPAAPAVSAPAAP